MSNMTIDQLVSGLEKDRVKALRAANLMLDTCKQEKREPSEAETAMLEQFDRKIDEIDDRLEYARSVQAEESDTDNRLENATVPDSLPGNANMLTGVNAATGQRSAPMADRTLPIVYADNGKSAVVARDQRFGDHWAVREHANRNADRDRMITGTHGSFGQMLRAMSTSGASALVPSSWSHDIIDLARNKSVSFQAGASLIPMPTKVVNIPRLTADPTPAWKAEGNAISAADATYDNVVLTATTLSALTVVSREFLQDAIDAEMQVMHSLSAQMALQLDLAILYGQLATGNEPQAGTLASPAPKGILKNLLDTASGQVLGAATNGTAQTTGTPFLELTNLLYQVKRQNETPTALVSNDALMQQYDSMYSTQNQPLEHPAILDSVPWLTTNAISSFTSGTMTSRATDVFAGDWRQVYVGQRLELDIQVLNERYAENGQVGIVAYWRGDVQLARPKAMAVYRYIQGAA